MHYLSTLNVQNRFSPGDITYAILQYGAFPYTCRCIDSLLQHEPEAKIIIIDNGSPDNSGKLLQDRYADVTNIKIVLSPINHGATEGRNQLLDLCSSPITVFMDNDAHIYGPVHPFLTHILSDEAVGACGTPLLLDPEYNCYSTSTETGDVDAIGTAFFAARTDVLRNFRFDTTLGPFGREDVDYSLQIKDAGFRLIGIEDELWRYEHKGGEQHQSSRLLDRDTLDAFGLEQLKRKWAGRDDLMEYRRQGLGQIGCEKCDEIGYFSAGQWQRIC